MAKRGRPPHRDVLTPREWEVLACIREGLSNEEIAERLGISLDGVKYHVTEILTKLGLENRHDAARWRPEERRPWPAIAPLLFWRRLGVRWLSPFIVTALTVAVAAGVGLLVWALMQTSGGERQKIVADSGLPVARVSIAAGDEHTCIVTQIGGVKCWGADQYGQLGNGSHSSAPTGPVGVVRLGTGVVAIAAGGSHTCALTSGGTVNCWGAYGTGQVASSDAPVAIEGLSSVVAAITAGKEHSCALTVAGGVKCWGNNQYGQLGDGSTDSRATPIDVVGLERGVIAISAGGDHTCAVMQTATAKCWGRDSEGELGDGAAFLSTEQQRISKTPLDVRKEDGTLLTGVAAVSGGGEFGHTCALLLTGTMKCWGSNAWGELGDGHCCYQGIGEQWARAVAVSVSVLTNVAALSAGGTDNQGGHTCATTRAGLVYCWGRGYEGQLGDGVANDVNLGGSNIPIAVVGIDGGAIAVTAGARHTCAIMSSGIVKCWGWNDSGQLGASTAEFSNRPVDVLDVLAAVR